MTRTMTWPLWAVLGVAAGGCGGKVSATPPPQKVGDGPFKPPPIVVNSGLPEVKIDGATGSLPLSSAASYGWSALLALHWPASTAASTRGVPDTTKTFGQPGTPVWITMRSKVEVFPGNASATVAPHGVELDGSGKPVNGPGYGYGDPPAYYYSTGLLQPCPGQPPVATSAFIVLDETTQVDSNQTFAGAAPAVDPRGYNSKPQLIRYAVKMSQPIYAYAMSGQYWYPDGPLATARTNYQNALASGQNQDPAVPYVNYAPVPPNFDPDLAGIEIKSA